MEHREQRLEQARASVRKGTDRDPSAYIAAARCCKQCGPVVSEALDILRTGLDRRRSISFAIQSITSSGWRNVTERKKRITAAREANATVSR